MSDQELIDLTIRTSLTLIKQLNRHPEYEGVIFSKELLAIGLEKLQKCTELTELERVNLIFFNRKWSIEPVVYESSR